MRTMRATCVIAGVMLVFATNSTAAGQTPSDAGAAQPPSAAPLPGVDSLLDKRVKAVSSRLRCPVCQGESIQDSPAELSSQMRTLVREQLASGRSEQDVLDYFTQKYGQWILLEPKAEGINLLVYWLPVVFIVIGGIGIAIAVRKWTRPARQIVATDVLTPSESSDIP
jgi:cytochrome c-type biogenesis protein CcmH